MYMSMIFTTCIYHVCQLLYYSIVHTLYIHGTDVSVHVYARWSGFQMAESDIWNPIHLVYVGTYLYVPICTDLYYAIVCTGTYYLENVA